MLRKREFAAVILIMLGCFPICFSVFVPMLWNARSARAADDVKVSQAEAPAEIIAATVVDIPKGTKVGVNPEALIIDENKKLWLNKHHPVGGETGVVVLHLEDGSLNVEISDNKLRWIKVPLTDDLKKTLLPVQKVTLIKPKDDGQPKPLEPKKN
jgi:hypothetical protein